MQRTNTKNELRDLLYLSGRNFRKRSLVVMAFLVLIFTLKVETYASIGCENLKILPASMPDGYRLKPYTVTLSGEGGIAPYNFSLIDPDMYFQLKGNLITANLEIPDNYSFQVVITDASGCRVIKNYIVRILCTAITITPTDSILPSARVGEFYSQDFNATGGNGLRRLWVSSGNVPRELAYEYPYLNMGLSGVPATPGEYRFNVKGSDHYGCTGERTYHLTIHPCPTLTILPESIPNYPLNASIIINLNICGGSGEYEVTGQNLPAFLRIDNYDYRKYNLTGTATAVGEYRFSIIAKDVEGGTITRHYYLNVIPPATLNYEAWTRVPWSNGKPSIAQLEEIINNRVAPNIKSKLRSTKAPYNVADNFGSRISGALVAPISAYYTFHIASANQSKLTIKNGDWVRVLCTVPDQTDSLQWSKYPSQRSEPIWLTKGTVYILQALHVATAGIDHLAVGWTTSFSGKEVTIISGEYFKPSKAPIEAPGPIIIPGPIVIPGPVTTPQFAREHAHEKLQMNAIPNVFSKDVSIEFSSPIKGLVELQLIDMKGNPVNSVFKGITEKAEIKKMELPYLNIEKGIYLLKLSNGRETIYRKVIKTE